MYDKRRHRCPHGRTVVAALVVVLASLVCLAGCSTRQGSAVIDDVVPPVTPSPEGSVLPGPLARPPAGSQLGKEPCLVGAPVAWRRAIAAGTLWHRQADGTTAGVAAPDGSAVLQQSDHGNVAEIALVGREHRLVHKVGDLPQPGTGQLTYNVVTRDYVAFFYALKQEDRDRNLWFLYLFDRKTNVLRRLISNPHDSNGVPLPGGDVAPILSGSSLYWVQPTAADSPLGTDELIQYDLATGRMRTMYRGRLGAVALVGAAVWFSRAVAASNPMDDNPPMTMAGFDERSGRPVAVPAGITAAEDHAVSMYYHSGTLSWSTRMGELRAWRVQWGSSITLLPGTGAVTTRLGLSDQLVPRVYRDFVVISAGGTYVLDLRTNSLARLGKSSTAGDLTGSILALRDYGSHDPVTGAGIGPSGVAVVDLAHLPRLPRCPH
ncbi:hypothetical protein M6D93_15070 [Jatrophihabitans telluris]|uniref:Lipoprotein n=1 Tax=Jatrophihabitans telluris TaxID=2038343 RepID=A0ABY4QWW1_9ACTN|nr:hypothetical protein [Jatrophihabitans telluris]UQX87612.1 hypothetical protein M6D93_15070 [Jatrophihabitans telluris]